MPKNAALVSFLGVTLAVAAGCSSGTPEDRFGAEPDYDTIQSQFTAPTGSFKAGQESSVLGSFSQKTSAQAPTPVGFGAGSGLTPSSLAPQSLRFLNEGVGGSKLNCPALQNGQSAGTCACPSGGTFEYEIAGNSGPNRQAGQPVTARMKARFDACATGEVTLTGREFVRIRATDSATGVAGMSMLIDAHLTATKGGESHQVDFTFLVEHGKTWFSIGVDDGSITVGSNDAGAGTITVRDRNGTWTCSSGDGKGTCVSSAGETRNF